MPRGGSNRAYDAEHLVERFWLGIWTGASRYIHCDWLRQDETLAAIFGYESLPRQSNYSRFFGKFSQGRNSHHPLLTLVSHTRMVGNAWLRLGNTAACSNCVGFMRETFDVAMAGMQVGLVRRLLLLHRRDHEFAGGSWPALHHPRQSLR